MLRYPTTYRDRNGEVETFIQNDRHHLQIMLRGVVFSGDDFDSLTPDRPLSDQERGMFILTPTDLCLCACTLKWSMPLAMLVNGAEVAAELRVSLVLGEPREDGGITNEQVTTHLLSPAGELSSRGPSGWFEDELLELQAQLPSGHTLECCIACAHSDYSPYGHGLWGSLACFRGCKDEYAKVGSKADLFAVWNKLTEFVPETFVCPDFCARRAGTGYRG